jgi:hypothetical protein
LLANKLTYANVVATVALFIAIGTGGAYAVDKIGAKDIKAGAVVSSKVRDGTLRGRDIKDGAISVKKLDAALSGELASLGAKKSLVNVVVRPGGATVTTPGVEVAGCKPNEVVVGGGYANVTASGPTTPINTFLAGPVANQAAQPTAGARVPFWSVGTTNTPGVRVYAMCGQFG